MIIWTNVSPCWESTASDFNDTPYEGSINVERKAPPRLDDPTANPEFLRYDAVIIDGDEPVAVQDLIGRMMEWDNDWWEIVYATQDTPRILTLYIERPNRPGA